MICCEKCGEWTSFYTLLDNGAEVCIDCGQEYEEGYIDYITDYGSEVER